jgi:hypothetical protein
LGESSNPLPNPYFLKIVLSSSYNLLKLKVNSSEVEVGDQKEEKECDNSYVRNNCCCFLGVQEGEERSYLSRTI